MDVNSRQTFSCFIFLDLISAIQNHGLGCSLTQNRMLVLTISVRHGFVNPYGYPGMGLTGTGTGTTSGTCSEPVPLLILMRMPVESQSSPSRPGHRVALSSSTCLDGVAIVVFVVLIRVVVVVVGVNIVLLLSMAGPWQRRWWWWWQLVAGPGGGGDGWCCMRSTIDKVTKQGETKPASGNESTANPACAAYAANDNPQQDPQRLQQPEPNDSEQQQGSARLQLRGSKSERLDDDDNGDNGEDGSDNGDDAATTATTATMQRQPDNCGNDDDDGAAATTPRQPAVCQPADPHNPQVPIPKVVGTHTREPRPSGLRFGGNSCPIEFPPTCEIRVVSRSPRVHQYPSNRRRVRQLVLPETYCYLRKSSTSYRLWVWHQAMGMTPLRSLSLARKSSRRHTYTPGNGGMDTTFTTYRNGIPPPDHEIAHILISLLIAGQTLRQPMDELKSLPYIVPKGHYVLACPAVSQVNKSLWFKPEEWIPSCWTNSEGQARQAFEQYAVENGEKVNYGFGALGTLISTVDRNVKMHILTRVPPPNYHVQITASTKGMKKPGTAPPAYLGSSSNEQQPTSTSESTYYMVVMLVQVTTVNQLIKRVKKGKFRSREDVLAQPFLMSNGHQGRRLPKIKTGHRCRSAEDDLEVTASSPAFAN
ncbi:hypothetical protein EDB85DRAFT_1894712 [Lactarius pseudohatsudake]|nr:hypothetical protein EDB85DRAFT_1894712 [Lactarius pseudohatsudake]